MARIFNGLLHYSAEEMASRDGGSRQSWSRLARLGRVPAVKFSEKWWFEPAQVGQALHHNDYVEISAGLESGKEEDNLSGLE